MGWDDRMGGEPKRKGIEEEGEDEMGGGEE
jgi:hypothetical protein